MPVEDLSLRIESLHFSPAAGLEAYGITPRFNLLDHFQAQG